MGGGIQVQPDETDEGPHPQEPTLAGDEDRGVKQNQGQRDDPDEGKKRYEHLAGQEQNSRPPGIDYRVKDWDAREDGAGDKCQSDQEQPAGEAVESIHKWRQRVMADGVHFG